MQKTDGNDKLVVLLADQTVLWYIHAKVVNRLVVLLGFRWASSLHRSQIGPIVQSIIVQGKLGGVDTDAKYITMKATGLKGDFQAAPECSQQDCKEPLRQDPNSRKCTVR